MTTSRERVRAPVMADVARLAGVSHQTVSRVLNEHPHVTPDTRSRVERAIDELGYRRNTAARALVTRRSGTLGVVSVGSSNYGPANTLIGIETAARADGYSVSFVSLDRVDRSSMKAALDHLTGAGVDGVDAAECGERGQAERAGCCIADAVGDGRNPVPRDGDEFGERAEGGDELADQAEHPLAGGEVADVGADGLAGPGEVAAEHDGEVVGHVAGGTAAGDHGVVWVDRGRGDPHQDLAVRRLRYRDVGEHRGRALGREHVGPHQ